MPTLEVILLEDVEHLGKAGQIAKAKAGYVRNYLLPRNLVLLLTRNTLTWLKTNLESLKKKSEEKNLEYKKIAEKIQQLGVIKIKTKIGQGGKLFGRVTSKNIVDQINKLSEGINLSKSSIQIENSYKNGIDKAGMYLLKIKLSSGVILKSQLNIVGLVDS